MKWLPHAHGALDHGHQYAGRHAVAANICQITNPFVTVLQQITRSPPISPLGADTP